MARKIIQVTELTGAQWAGHVIAVCNDGTAYVGNLALLFSTGSHNDWVQIPDVPQVTNTQVSDRSTRRARP